MDRRLYAFVRHFRACSFKAIDDSAIPQPDARGRASKDEDGEFFEGEGSLEGVAKHHKRGVVIGDSLSPSLREVNAWRGDAALALDVGSCTNHCLNTPKLQHEAWR